MLTEKVHEQWVGGRNKKEPGEEDTSSTQGQSLAQIHERTTLIGSEMRGRWNRQDSTERGARHGEKELAPAAKNS